MEGGNAIKMVGVFRRYSRMRVKLNGLDPVRRP
ncbi:MAG: hypothetical protein ACI965_002437, partial [Paraglaciecola sp.]